MEPKPAHLSLTYAEQFKDRSIAEVYHYRPPYTDEVIDALIKLITDEPRTILDAGCGTGDLARRLVHQVERVDAVDFSQAMLHEGSKLPDGNHAHLHWINGRVEDANIHPPYALITAGESLHWMEWDIVLPLFRRILTPHGYLAIVERGTDPTPWTKKLQTLINQFSTNREYRPYNLVAELEQRHLFHQRGKLSTRPIQFVQSGEEYIHSIHSRNGFSRERMGRDAALAFDEEVRTLLAPFQQNGLLTLSVTSQMVWGTPLAS
jgi:ubiquinone/menaquinone biosynthesis C-methylase UbiE